MASDAPPWMLIYHVYFCIMIFGSFLFPVMEACCTDITYPYVMLTVIIFRFKTKDKKVHMLENHAFCWKTMGFLN